jgi:UDP-N-acetylmuramate dehydrogenase
MLPSPLNWFEKERAGFSGDFQAAATLASFSYYKIGGPAALLLAPRSLADLAWISRGLRETRVPFFILGAGSNLLISDEGFSGVVIRTTKMNSELALDGDTVTAGASVLVASLLRKASQEGWGGLEFLTGVPGSMGGVVTMNAGTHLGDTQGALKSASVVPLLSENTAPVSVPVSEFHYSYRKNQRLKQGDLVWAAQWKIVKEEPSLVKKRIDELLVRRKNSQPVDFPSCGSVFKNPKESGKHAWQVIEAVGLRGHRIGDAQFAEKHCNFIINHGKAKASDVKALIELAKAQAKEKLGITLEEEVKYLGD